MDRLIASRNRLPEVYVRNGLKGEHASLALTLNSAFTDSSREMP